jgi:hypothetical protein
MGPLYWPKPTSVKKIRALRKEIDDWYDRANRFFEENENAPEDYCWKCNKLLTDECNLNGDPKCIFVDIYFDSVVRKGDA